MDSALTRILVLVVSIFTTHSREFTQRYQDSSNNLITDFMNLSNRMFLFINCSLSVVFTVCFANFRGSLEELKWAPCGPFHTHFDVHAVDKQGMCKTCTVREVLLLEVPC